MKKTGFKKFLLSKWTLIIAAVLVVAAAGTVTALNWNNWFGKTEDTAVVASKDIFWNVDRDEYAYKSDSFTSSRVPDKDDGYYHVLFSNVTQQGRAVTRRVADKKVVDKIDRLRAMGLKFDDKGIVVDVIPLEELGDTISVKRGYVVETKEDGTTVEIDTSESLDGVRYSVKVPALALRVDVCGATGSVGKTLEGNLEEGDCIWAISDKKDNIRYVFLTNRTVVGTLYWNKTRQYDSKLMKTKRTPDADGYYSFELAANGTCEVYKTKDIKIANQMDAQAARTFGLEVGEGNIITAYKSVRDTTGGNGFGSWYNITEINDKKVTAVKYAKGNDTGTTITGTLANKCHVYDVTDLPGTTYGAVTELKVGDQIQGWKNSKAQICYIFVLGGRTVDSDMYWNTSRKWSSGKWTRTAEADGRYVFKLGVASKGTIQEFWTRDAKLAQELDEKYPGQCFGLKLNGNQIIGHYTAAQVSGGASWGSWYDITSKDGNKLHAKKIASGSDKGTEIDGELADKCYIINTQDGCKQTTVDVGDRVHGMRNNIGKVSYLFIINKAPKVVKTSYCQHCGKNVAWYGFGGGTSTKDGAHYVLLDDIKLESQFNVGATGNTTTKYTVTDNVLDLAGHKLTGKIRTIAVQRMCKLSIMDSVGGGVITSSNTEVSDMGLGVWARESSTVDMYGGTIDMTGVKNNGFYGTSVAVLNGATFNLRGGTIKGGTSLTVKGVRSDGKDTDPIRGWGGNVYVGGNATFNMSGGTITGGTAGLGGNIFAGSNSVFNLSGGVIEGGKAVGTPRTTAGGTEYSFGINGGNMYTEGKINITGGTIKGGYAKGTGDYYEAGGGNVALFHSGTLTMSGGSVEDGVSTNGGNFYVYNSTNASVISGGTVKGGSAERLANDGQKINGGNNTNGWGGNGGNFYVMGGKLDIKDEGVIEGGKANGSNGGGGNIALRNRNATVSGVVNMSGGTIKNGTSVTNKAGANLVVYNATNVNFKMSGGTIEGYVLFNKGTFTVSDTAKITGGAPNLTIVNDKIVVGALTDGANIGITASGKFSDTGAEYKKYFTSDDADLQVVEDNGGLKLLSSHSHYACGKPEGTTDEIKGHSHKDEKVIYYAPLTQEMIKNTYGNKLPLSGSFYLKEDITVTSQANLEDNFDICFNGHTITVSTNNRLMLLGYKVSDTKDTVVNFTDCVGNGGVKKTLAKGTNSGAIIQRNDKNDKGKETGVEVNFYGGKFDASAHKSTAAATLFQLDCSANKKDKGTVNIYDGEFIGGITTNSSGSIRLIRSTVLNMYGGTIKGGTATIGGNVNVSNGTTFNLKGGIVEGGKAVGTAKTSGGISYSDTVYGGNIHVEGTLNIDGGTVKGGVSKSVGDYKEAFGGNITIMTTGKFNMKSGEVLDGTATNGGNISFNSNTTAAEISGGTIKGGKAVRLSNDNKVGSTNGWGGNGGNIVVYGGNLNLKGGNIEDGNAAGSNGGGGNIFVRISSGTNYGKLVMSGGTVKGGISATDKAGANLVVTNNDNTAFEMSGGTIEGYAFLRQGKFTVSGTAKITGGDTNLKIASGKKITVGELKDGAKIGITMAAAPGKFADAGKDAIGYFTSDNELYNVSVDGGGLALTVK